MKELLHPQTLAVYGIDPETNLVCVTDKGKSGLYTMYGVWQSGDLFHVDPQMCLWIGGPSPESAYSTSFRQM